MIKKTAEIIIPILCIIGFIALQYYLKEHSPNAQDAKLNEIQLLSREVPVHPSFIKTGENTGSRAMDAGLSQYFRSNKDFESVKNFYVSSLTKSGWTQLKDEDKLVFQKGEIELYIDFMPGKDADWNYGFSYVWHNNQ